MVALVGVDSRSPSVAEGSWAGREASEALEVYVQMLNKECWGDFHTSRLLGIDEPGVVAGAHHRHCHSQMRCLANTTAQNRNQRRRGMRAAKQTKG